MSFAYHKLSKDLLRQRRLQRQRETAKMTKCRCGNVAKLGKQFCTRCEEQEEEKSMNDRYAGLLQIQAKLLTELREEKRLRKIAEADRDKLSHALARLVNEEFDDGDEKFDDRYGCLVREQITKWTEE